MKNIFLIFGGSSTAIEISEVITEYYSTRFEEVHFIVGDNEKNQIENSIFDKDLNEYIQKQNAKVFCIISISNQTLRYKCSKSIEINELIPFTVIHPKSYIANSAEIGSGVYIAANASISSNVKIRNYVIINYNSVIGHDSIINDNVIINPGVVVGGNVVVNERVIIGSNSFILQGKTIGADSTIDAMTYIDKDIDSRKISSNRNLNIYP